MYDHTQARIQTSTTPNTAICPVRDSWGLLPGGFHGGQSVSVISVYVSSQSWEWHETHKASLCQSVPPHCHRKKKAHISEKLELEFMLVLSKKAQKEMSKAQTA